MAKFFSNSIGFLPYALLLIVLFLTISCTESEKKRNEALKARAHAMQGNGDMLCTPCHKSSSPIGIAEKQYMNSIHYQGFTEDGRKECAGCHTHEGFMFSLSSDENVKTLKSDLEKSSHIGCRTCHQIEVKNSKPLMTLVGQQPIHLIDSDRKIDMGSGNLCARCHQINGLSRIKFPPTNMQYFKPESKFWGPHYGPQANMIAGVTPYPFSGKMPYPSENKHDIAKINCVACHMKGSNQELWGHSMMMKSAEGNTREGITCKTSNCHAGEEFTGFNRVVKNQQVQSEIKKLMKELRYELAKRQVIDTMDPVVSYIRVEKMPALYACAAYNLFLAEKDRSYGIHHYSYTRALLVNTLEAIKH